MSHRLPILISLKYKVGKKLLFCFVFQFDIVKHMRQDQITNGLVHAITSVRFHIFALQVNVGSTDTYVGIS